MRRRPESRTLLRVPDTVLERRGVPVLVCDPEGPRIATPQDALDLIGAAFDRADVVAIPVARLDDKFFSLRSGLAGEVMQKFVNYRTRLAIVGDISEHVSASTALRDLVKESNRGRQVWFVADLDELDTHLG
jgi:pyruvate/2-oxoacid:ferredoxin oxidoreductase alpha subunit